MVPVVGSSSISIHALREEGDPDVQADAQEESISIHALREEGDAGPGCCRTGACISIHALREEGDDRCPGCACQRIYFYPRPPRGGRPRPPPPAPRSPIFLSTPSARRATVLLGEQRVFTSISIHALREEGDAAPASDSPSAQNFYPRPPRGGRLRGVVSDFDVVFISIHALREEGDGNVNRMTQIRGYFYPRPPRGGRHERALNNHADNQFLSTPSARRATRAARLAE